MKSPKKIFKIISFIIVLCVIAYFFKQKIKEGDELRADHKFTIGKITSWRSTRSGIELSYEYKVADSLFNSNGKYITITKEEALTLIGKTFPVVYSPKDPSNHEMLVNQNHYEYLGINIPDSARKYFPVFE